MNKLTKDLKPGDTLSNGAIVIEIDNGIVLALNPGATTPFVTWKIDKEGATYWGNYHYSIDAAALEYSERAGKVKYN